jgi:osmotically-inducible protein OsmY
MLAAGLLVANCAHAGETEDVALTVAVRKSLGRDEKLANLGLGATAVDGKVTLWGAVPAAELIARAESRVKEIAGVKAVFNDIHIQPPFVSPALPLLRKRAGVPDPVVLMPLPGLPELPARERPALAEDPDQSRRTVAKEPLSSNGPIRPTATLMRPEPIWPQADLTKQIEAMLSRNARYDGLHITIQSGLVRLSGTIANWNDLWAFSEDVSKLPGVNRVVVDRIAIAKKP